jgi:hypothetical protein
MQPYNIDLSWIDWELKDILQNGRMSILTKELTCNIEKRQKTKN